MEILWQTGSGGGGGSGTGFNGIVDTYAELPVDDSADVGEVWLVRQGTGVWFFDRHQRGLYQRIDDTGVRDADWQYLGEWQEEFNDDNFQVYNTSDPTKVVKLDVSAVSTATTRTLIVPNENGTIALLSDVVDALNDAEAYTDTAIAALSAVYQPLDADLTSWAGVTRATGFDTFTATPSGANLASLLTSALPITKGGTGITSYAQGDILYGNGGGTLSKLAEPGLPGYVLSAIGGSPSWVQLSTLTATLISGAANQVFANGTVGIGQTGPVTLTLPQDIHTGATPQFSGLGLSAAGIANRIVGDFSGATLGNRTTFVTATTNAGTSVPVIPNGTNRNANLITANTSDLANSGLAVFGINSTAVSIGSAATGTGTVLPIEFQFSGIAALTLATSGAATFASTVRTTRLAVNAAPGGYRLYVVGGDNDVALLDNDGSDLTNLYLANAGSIKGGFQYSLSSNNFRFLSVTTGGNLDFGTEATDRMRVSAAGNVLVGTTSESGLSGIGNIRGSNALMTGTPSGGTARPWKLGSIVTSASALDATRYIEAEINGVAVKIAVIT